MGFELGTPPLFLRKLFMELDLGVDLCQASCVGSGAGGSQGLLGEGGFCQVVGVEFGGRRTGTAALLHPRS